MKYYDTILGKVQKIVSDNQVLVNSLESKIAEAKSNYETAIHNRDSFVATKDNYDDFAQIVADCDNYAKLLRHLEVVKMNHTETPLCDVEIVNDLRYELAVARYRQLRDEYSVIVNAYDSVARTKAQAQENLKDHNRVCQIIGLDIAKDHTFDYDSELVANEFTRANSARVEKLREHIAELDRRIASANEQT